MSWIERFAADFVIKTGDSKEYKVLWNNAIKALEWNIVEFNYENVPGTDVKKGQPKGRKFPLEFYFQGENHLDQCLAFELSANDKRPWQITHPLYGIIIAHVATLEIDHSGRNVSKITGVAFETITDDNPKAQVVPLDKIIADKAQNDFVAAQSLANNNPSPSAADVSDMAANNKAFYDAGKVSAYYNEKQAAAIEAAKNGKALVAESKDDITSSAESSSEKYLNLYNEANTSLADAQDKSAEVRAEVAKKQMDVIAYSAEMKVSVLSRLDLINRQYSDLKLRLNKFLPIRKSQKHLYENNGGALISSLAIAAATPLSESDYENKRDVISVIDKVVAAYNGFIADLDGLQTENGGQEEGYIPDANCLIRLNDLINYTVSNLQAIALDAKQERVLILESDSNIILLAHRFYGLKAEDSTLNDLIKANGLGLTEMLEIKKGRKIAYYV